MDDAGAGCLFLMLLGFAGVGSVAWLIAFDARSRRANNKRILEEAASRAAAEVDVSAQAFTDVWVSLKEQFPFLPTPMVSDTEADTIRDAIRETLASVPSLGELAESGIDAPELPAKARVRHLYVMGKTGSGKSTFLEHLIHRDMVNGHGVAIVSPEGEFFRDQVLPNVPRERADDVVYFAPADIGNTLTLNPLALGDGEDPHRAAEDLYTIFKRAMGDAAIGPRMDPILQNAFAALVGKPGMTFFEVKRMLEDPIFRDEVVSREGTDPYVASFWRETYPSYPSGAHLSILNRLDRFLRPKAIRSSLCAPLSSFSVRDAIRGGKILLVNLYGLSEANRLLIGQILLSKFQLELMRRELSGGRKPPPFFIHADEFQSYAGVAEGTWRELLSRGRKYGLGLTLSHQYPAQLPRSLQDEIFGNVNSLLSFKLGSKDAGVVRKELLHKVVEDDGDQKVEPVPMTDLLELPVGHALCRYAGGRAVEVKFPPPLKVANPSDARALIRQSRKTYGLEQQVDPEVRFRQEEEVLEPESFLE